MRRCMAIALVMTAFTRGSASGQESGDPKRGGEFYRACVACHSLLPDTHLTGPSLAGVFGREAGSAAGFDRYSPGLRTMDLEWNEDTLDAWLADPQAMIPGNYMIFRGIEDDQARADLIAFLALATAPGGHQSVVARGLAPPEYVEGQRPEPLGQTSADQRVTALRHCRDSYFVTTADGAETPFWEMNVRLKLDTRATGPASDRPVIVGAGMMGDRVSIIFASVDDLRRFVVEKC